MLSRKEQNPILPIRSLFVYLITLVLFILVNLILKEEELFVRLISGQIVIVIPALLFVFFSKNKNFVETFSIKKIKLLDLFFVIILALFAAPGITFIGDLFLKIVPSYKQELKSLKEFVSGKTLGLTFPFLLIIIGILPALCEEFLFRGFILNDFCMTGISKIYSAVFVGILFGIFHLNLIRIIPTSIIGIMLGLVTVYTGSIIAPIVYHMINNMLVVFLSNILSSNQDLKTTGEFNLPGFIFMIFCSVIAFIAMKKIITRNKKV